MILADDHENDVESDLYVNKVPASRDTLLPL